MKLLLVTVTPELAAPPGPVLRDAVAFAVAVVGGHQREEALVVLLAGRAALEVSAHPRHRRVGVGAGQRQLDVAVELLEALLAGQLGSGGGQDAGQAPQGVVLGVAHGELPRSWRSGSRPRAARHERSRRRASCSVL